MLNVGLWRDMAKKEWTDGQVTWKKKHIEIIGCLLGAMNQHHIMLELPKVSQSVWEVERRLTCEHAAHTHLPLSLTSTGAIVRRICLEWHYGTSSPNSVGWNLIQFIQNFSCCCFEKHGQEWCKFDLEWALFKERLEVADKNMADSKLDAQVIFDGLVAFFSAKWRDGLKQGRTIAAADSPKRNIYVAMVVIRVFTFQNFMKSPRQVANSTNQHLGLYSSIKVHFQLKGNAEHVICIHTCKQSRNFDTLWE